MKRFINRVTDLRYPRTAKSKIALHKLHYTTDFNPLELIDSILEKILICLSEALYPQICLRRDDPMSASQ